MKYKDSHAKDSQVKDGQVNDGHVKGRQWGCEINGIIKPIKWKSAKGKTDKKYPCWWCRKDSPVKDYQVPSEIKASRQMATSNIYEISKAVMWKRVKRKTAKWKTGNKIATLTK